MVEDEVSFLRRRAEEEAFRVRVAASPEAAAAHAQLAAAYLARLAVLNLPTSTATQDVKLQRAEGDVAGKVVNGMHSRAR